MPIFIFSPVQIIITHPLIYPLISVVFSTWLLVALSKHFKISDLAKEKFKGLGWLCPVSAALIAFEKFFLFWLPMNI